MKINTLIWHTLYQIRFFIVGLFKQRFLSSRANNEVKTLKKRTKLIVRSDTTKRADC